MKRLRAVIIFALLVVAVAFGLLPGSPDRVVLAHDDVATGHVSGVVWRDSNHNGSQDPGELPLAGYPVYLQRTGEEVIGAMVAVAHSDGGGVFEFTNLEEGSYHVFPEEGEYVLVDVGGVSASATVELPVPAEHRLFLPFASG